jgi:hypothetical protein
VLALSLLSGSLLADEAGKRPSRAKIDFGVLQSPALDEARALALAWLQGTGKTDAATMAAFDALWNGDKRLLDRVAETLALGDAEAKKLLDEARDANTAAPQTVPAAIKDAKRPIFYRANLALAYAKALSNRRIYEEGLEALKAVKVEDVVDPSSYLFYKAVAEHALLLKKEADDTILRLLDDVVDAPERHKMVAALMHFDMRNWKEKDLGWISRKMTNIERRLDLARGGPKTQKMQREVVMRLDELIKRLEQQGNNPGPGNDDGSNPNGTPQPSNPMQDSHINNVSGPGNVDAKKLKETAKEWGRMPEKERAKAMVELTKDLPPRHREVIENYFKKLAGGSEPR